MQVAKQGLTRSTVSRIAVELLQGIACHAVVHVPYNGATSSYSG